MPLGGLSEIGMNMMALVHRGRCMVIDCGVSFPDAYLPGVDLIMPKIDFFHEYDIDVDALVLTHSHEDHLGAVGYLHHKIGSPPIYGTDFTLAMLEPRMKEAGKYPEKKINKITPGKKFKAGVFEIEPLRVTHSLVDCVGLAIQTPQGMLVHTGDFKIDHDPIDNWQFDEQRFRELGDQGVRLLMSDSTNVESPGWSLSEKALSESLEQLIGSVKTGKIIVSLFSSNIHRIQILMDIAAKVGRRLMLCGRSVLSNVDLARQHGHLSYDWSQLITSREIDDIPSNKIMVLSTGTQAEARSALSKMSHGTHPDVDIDEGDTIIFSSRHIPGNEKRISLLMNNLHRLGAKVIDFRDAFVHVSGHARQDELKTIFEWVRPQNFLPVHGEYRMLCKHYELAKNTIPNTKTFVAENGDVVELSDKVFRKLAERVTAGKLFLDEARNLVPEETIKFRRKMGSQGIVLVSAVVRRKDFKPLMRLELESLGLPGEIDWIELEQSLEELLSEYRGDSDVDFESLEEEISLQVKRYLRRENGLKPVVIPHIYAV
ncbi:MAG: ribonuclease J [Deltaproteobacteria bacterium CG11_big_fil_rev_8_21_14_0_20_45_16]|nr:MAG: ribonuclease J [Deltaproteobacteria bacterium CG11_big_fil_rev_8_21_14_0_20_45_16]